MTALPKATAASTAPMPLSGAVAVSPQQAAQGGQAANHPLSADGPCATRSTAAGVSSALFETPATLRKPDCPSCGRDCYGCICGIPDAEPEYFRPGLNRDPDWYRVEL